VEEPEMPPIDADKHKELFAQQFWSFKNVIDVACGTKNWIEPDNIDHNERNLFEADLTTKILEAVQAGRIIRVRQCHQYLFFDPDEPAVQLVKNIGRGVFPLIALGLVYWSLGYLPTGSTSEVVNRQEFAFEIGVGFPILGLLSILALFYGELVFRKFTATTPKRKLKFAIFNAERKGLKEAFFEAVRIPTNSSTHSKGNRPLIPRQFVHLSERSDAGGFFLLEVDELVNVGRLFSH
jgi:hypothetical protein